MAATAVSSTMAHRGALSGARTRSRASEILANLPRDADRRRGAVSPREEPDCGRMKAAPRVKAASTTTIVTFAPLYLANLCVNGCVFCASAAENTPRGARPHHG